MRQVIVTPLGDKDAMPQLQAQRARETEWRRKLAEGTATVAEDPFPLQPVLRLYDESSMTVDLRSGLAATGFPTAEEMRKFIWSQLALPGELSDLPRAQSPAQRSRVRARG